MNKSLIIPSLFLLLTITTYGQQLSIDLHSFYGIWNNESSGYSYGGGGLTVSYEHPLKKGDLQCGLAFRTIDWGNQITITTAYRAPYISKSNWSFNGLTSIGLGSALFQQRGMFVWSIGYLPEFVWLTDRRISLSAGLGFRYTNNPAYKNYGSINQLFELPLKIGVQIQLAREDN
ncbi:hypothetical protein [Parvicella tangerina]|uniref:Uncharacterized protein n=1 Tax=Parvicella tangerina TaxID=2829795 RepID=A0A916NA54_9FLAO|nr:hypothetical protein [Parvicella tangerina]CAG5080150.1 hypothetical protein CRYO30217_01200 [Parvicella tangerina]